MAIITTCVLIGLGVTALVGTGSYLWKKDDVEAETLTARIKEIDHLIENNNIVIGKYNTIKSKVIDAINYLEAGKSDFINGGHVYNGIPLANSELLDTITKLDSSSICIDNIIQELYSNINELKQEKKECNARLTELNK